MKINLYKTEKELLTAFADFINQVFATVKSRRVMELLTITLSETITKENPAKNKKQTEIL